MPAVDVDKKWGLLIGGEPVAPAGGTYDVWRDGEQLFIKFSYLLQP